MAKIFAGQFNEVALAGVTTVLPQNLLNGSIRQIPVDDDIALVRRSRCGDRQAYSKLVERHERKVMNLISHVITSVPGSSPQFQTDVEDLTQEVFVQAWKALQSFRGDSRFSTWLYRIAVNRALKERKRVRSYAQYVCPSQTKSEEETGYKRADLDIISQGDPCEVLMSSNRDKLLWAAVDSLPEKQRVVVLLHYFESCSCDEIARIVDCSVGTVWSRLHYGCLKLRHILSTFGDGSEFTH